MISGLTVNTDVKNGNHGRSARFVQCTLEITEEKGITMLHEIPEEALRENELRKAIDDGSVCKIRNHSWVTISGSYQPTTRRCVVCGRKEYLVVKKEWKLQ